MASTSEDWYVENTIFFECLLSFINFFINFSSNVILKSKSISEDNEKSYEKIVQNHTDTYIKLIDEKAKKVITDFKAQFEKIDQPSREILEPVINGLIKSNNTNFKGVGQPLRIVLTGSKFGPGIYDIILSLGKKEVQKRLDAKIAWNYSSSFSRGRGFRFDFI